MSVQRGPAAVGSRQHAGAPHSGGMEQCEHPKVREARMAARALADQIGARELPGMNCGPPPERALVCYDDL